MRKFSSPSAHLLLVKVNSCCRRSSTFLACAVPAPRASHSTNLGSTFQLFKDSAAHLTILVCLSSHNDKTLKSTLREGKGSELLVEQVQVSDACTSYHFRGGRGHWSSPGEPFSAFDRDTFLPPFSLTSINVSFRELIPTPEPWCIRLPSSHCRPPD